MVQLKDALVVYNDICQFLEPLGYNCALYGSVVKFGEGNDLDILVVPHRPGVSHQYLTELLHSKYQVLRYCGFDSVYRSVYGNLCVGFVHSGISIDMCIVNVSFNPLDYSPV